MFIRKGAVLALAVMGVASGAQAFSLLSPGDAVLVPDLALPGDAVAIDFRSDDFVGMNALSEILYTGTVDSYVFRQAAGNLIFGYIIYNDLDSIDEISAVSMTDFAGWITEVGQDPAAAGPGGIPSTSAARSSTGGTVTFNFTRSPLGRGALEQDKASYGLMIRTNATDYTRGTVNVLNGAIATVESFAPVPEPASIAALGVGAAALLRRRKKA